jgi:hypothetical protein
MPQYWVFWGVIYVLSFAKQQNSSRNERIGKSLMLKREKKKKEISDTLALNSKIVWLGKLKTYLVTQHPQMKFL